jgi:hypothetical protein
MLCWHLEQQTCTSLWTGLHGCEQQLGQVQQPAMQQLGIGDMVGCTVSMYLQCFSRSVEGRALLYGLAGVSPDRGLIGEFLVAFQDAMLAP